MTEIVIYKDVVIPTYRFIFPHHPYNHFNVDLDKSTAGFEFNLGSGLKLLPIYKISMYVCARVCV